jgi:hypothetical protein
VNDNRVAFYSLTPGTLRAPLPPNWKADQIVAATLSTKGRTRAEVRVAHGAIEVTTAAQQPIIVYRDKSLAKIA